METTRAEIARLEEDLRQAELNADARFFEEYLADDAVLVSPEGPMSFGKLRLLRLHQSGKRPKSTRVDNADMRIIDHGTAAVVTCRRIYEGPEFTGTLTFMRLWVKKKDRWQIVAASVSN
jgi:ketosteroid isomerase-like protein